MNGLEKEKKKTKTTIKYKKEMVEERYEVRLEYKNDNGDYIQVPYWCPLHFPLLSFAKGFCNDLAFRLDYNERYAVYDRLCDSTKCIYYTTNTVNKNKRSKLSKYYGKKQEEL